MYEYEFWLQEGVKNIPTPKGRRSIDSGDLWGLS